MNSYMCIHFLHVPVQKTCKINFKKIMALWILQTFRHRSPLVNGEKEEEDQQSSTINLKICTINILFPLTNYMNK